MRDRPMARALAALAFAPAAIALAAAAAPAPIEPKEFSRAAAEFVLPSTFEIKVTPSANERLWIFADVLAGTEVSIRVSPIKDIDLEVVLVGDADFRGRKLDVPPQPEGFLLEVSPRGFLLMGRDRMGVQWGLLKLRELLDAKRRTIPSFSMRDWPDLSWRCVHVASPREGQYGHFTRFVEQVLLPYRFNTIILEINYSFAFQSHPELTEPDSPDAASFKKVRDFLVQRGFRVIPQFNCLGHQSWKARPSSLLRAYPELDETPKLELDDKSLYCRSWCPRHPKLAPILHAIWSEMDAAIRSDHFHIGMDEVFLIAEKDCPRCGASSPGEVFYAAVAQYHAFFAGSGREVLMWGDRLIDARESGYSRFEASETDTWKALAYLPRDIIICDWHYGVREEYPSLKHFLDAGFRALACTWRDPGCVEGFWRYAQKVRTDRFLGFVATTWVALPDLAAALFEGRGSDQAKGAAACMKLVGKLCWEGKRGEGQAAAR